VAKSVHRHFRHQQLGGVGFLRRNHIPRHVLLQAAGEVWVILD
jgi:hypothetical protein